MADERWFTVPELAERLKVTDQALRRWLRTGKITGRKLGGKAGWRVRESEVERFMQEDRSDQP